MIITGQQIANEAKTWLGVPFCHQGRTRFGVDCIGYVSAVFHACGVPAFMDNLPINYSRIPQKELLDGLLGIARQTADVVPGVIILIKWPKTEHASHVGIFTGNSMIHCYQTSKRVVEQGYQEPWLRMTDSLWKMDNVRYE